MDAHVLHQELGNAHRVSKPPAEAEKAATDGVLDDHRAATGARSRARSLRDVGPRRRLTSPHAVHNLGLDDLEKPGWLGDAPMTAWRYLIEEGDAVVASAEVGVDSKARCADSTTWTRARS